MSPATLQLDPRDNVGVALATLAPGTTIRVNHADCPVVESIPAKHKIALVELMPGDLILMYGMVVGEVMRPIPQGGLVSTSNVRHRAAKYTEERQPAANESVDSSLWRNRTFMGYRRADGLVGTRNYWIVVPLVFCENRNVEQMREAFEEELGYGRGQNQYRKRVRELIQSRSMSQGLLGEFAKERAERVFPNLDGIRFLTHQLGCGGTRQDAQALCGLLAGYIHHPNVAGATVLSLGCQNAQASILMDELRARDPELSKPVLIFDQQKSGREESLLNQALDQTYEALVEANRATRSAAPASELTVGLQCGGSDGFSGISANPAVGYVSDLIVGLGGKTMLSEFPELHGVEQELINRCETDELAERFAHLMQTYAQRAKAVNSGFDFNPSPGNIRDGLITDAMKSAGAARKGGISPIRDVIDYPEFVRHPGLTLQCTPGNDVESVTAQVGAGCTVVLFTTGLGTPTGNPVAPVVKISSNSQLAERMPDIIDFDAGDIVDGSMTISASAERLLDLSIRIASGECLTKAELLCQYDFIPWKRGVSL
ncbi:UxaA family hydrolase [Acidicapsa dinghuensis]|uniref:UxaA family hydrolase n=1 Tax=Acidicapsa dinghuensis TaxID=2218256 RepID=A0ABW1EG64_9BACT|nr:altronate dehydratase family protein [Acidicapsa dinghuensis]